MGRYEYDDFDFMNEDELSEVDETELDEDEQEWYDMRREQLSYMREQAEYERARTEAREQKLRQFKKREVKVYRESEEEELLYKVMMLGPEWRIISMQVIDGEYRNTYVAFVEKSIDTRKKKQNKQLSIKD